MNTALHLLLILFLVPAGPLSAQSRTSPTMSQSPGLQPVPVANGDEVQRKQAQAANQQRQADIKRDTEKMMQLISELNTYVQKDNQNILSVDAVKKAEQIEKLAHSVKSKMTQAY
jgi:ABC-type oligopeptide transport system substrate-binding subunit